ncbi:MAG: UDP-N-acetylglucosamine 2-epimerase (non-hydrolyzing) [Candidatus Saganbacteria bacterium]|nr:UDP-N-acetylglucosamine 2-epimerase (non-hydrolyzing) [Candidatus Saganbacteria bacterium]
MKVITVLGTRPEIIRLASVMAMLDKYVNHIIVHTGQNYDYELNEIFFKELDVRKPDYFLGVDCSTLGNIYGNILIESEKIFVKEKPDAVLILGDTNSSIAALIAKRMKIPIYHMEAGNRCFDFNVPEEINRRIMDHISDFNLVYTEHARRNLLAEGLPSRNIYLTGSPMKEVLGVYLGKIKKSKILKKLKLKTKKYFIVSMHREENIDNKSNLVSLLNSLNALCDKFGFPVIVSTHPRTRKRLKEISSLKMNPLIKFMKPFGFLDYVHLQQNAFCAISDSGTISEESSILSFPAVTIRNSLERPEALDSGNIVITGLLPETIVDAVRITTLEWENSKNHPIPAEYEIENVSLRVVKLIIGTAKLCHIWSNIKTN